ncbi:Cyclase family protein [Candidatus Nitrospira nitrosa]|uniref:Cyclase family protein n=1 Tax=Candidatus Nitrospira nitrosa TaxID=1742972 RepID=A0A0S4L7K1_9BACT|nr:cyclase family protein [Candidatus Nitrospira nitrosa]CUS31796.1 Cyclase family protein [Candidatus Nitrospira nitrosa]
MLRRLTHMTSMVIAELCFLSIIGCVANPQHGQFTWEQSRIIDLTHSFGSDTIVWPTEEDFKLIVQHAEHTSAGYYYASNRMELPEHGGTHIDAPIHFAKGKQTLDQIPIDRMVGAAVKIDATGLCARDRDYLVAISDFERWEAGHGRIPNGAIVLLNTGYAKFWPSRKYYLGTELRGEDGVRALHFPGLHPEAAIWLARERHVKAVGIDTASIDYGQSTKFETHVALLSHNVPVFENLDNLDELPGRGFDVIALPMKIAGGTGGPLRIIAVVSPSR